LAPVVELMTETNRPIFFVVVMGPQFAEGFVPRADREEMGFIAANPLYSIATASITLGVAEWLIVTLNGLPVFDTRP